MCDIILTRNVKKEIKRINLGNLRYFLGLEIGRSKKRIIMNKRKYALKFLTDASILACKPTLIPIDNHAKLSSTGSVPFTDVQA